jgi:beta-glucosidase
MLRTLALFGYAATVAAQFDTNHTQYGTSPPVYPSPQISGVGGWDAALEKARAFLAELTTKEKAQIVTGARHLHRSHLEISKD